MEKNQNGYPSRNGNGMPAPAPRSGANTREENWRDMAERNEKAQQRGACSQGDMAENGAGCIGDCNYDSQGIGSLALAYAYVPMQKFRLLYNPEKALASGTLFEELDLPLGVYNNGK